jgi:hypothetical protein
MAIPKLIDAQRDFSAGELDRNTKRADEISVMKAGARQMSNWRILSSKALQNRPGRSALFKAIGRVEEISMPNGNVFFINFAAGTLKIFNAAGTQVFTSSVKGDGTTALPWTAPTLGSITYAIIGLSIYIAYADGAPNNVPQILAWDGVSQTSTWTLSTYAESVTPGGQKRTAFYRIAPGSITLQPSATSGSVTITFSSPVLTAGMVGTNLEFCGRQLQITGVSSGTVGTAIVLEPLPPGQTIVTTGNVGTFNIGDLVIGSISGAQGIVTSTPTTQVLNCHGQVGPFSVGDTLTGAPSGATGTITYWNNTINYGTVSLSSGTLFAVADVVTDSTPPNNGHHATVGTVTTGALNVQLLPTSSGLVNAFTTSDNIVGPSASGKVSTVTTTTPQPVSIWTQEVMNAYWGYPSSMFADQNRLGLCNIPSVPSGIIWSAIGLPLDLYTGALAGQSIFELAPDQSQVLYVVAGMESSEFVFTDRAVYYIPITAANPLEPGSVAFNKLSDFGCLPNVQPRRAEQSIVYIKAGGSVVGAVQAPGAYYRPYVIDNISEMHSHLFVGLNPIAIAIPSGPTQFPESYLYIALAGGGIVFGHYAMRQGLIEPGPEGKPAIGWLPWSGAGTATWVAARQGDVIFTASYGGNSVVEKLDNNQYLDGALAVNALPAPFTPPGGKGPLFNFPGPNSTVTLIDQGTRFMGTYAVDANGFIVPQFSGGENLTSAQLVAGQPWTAMLEPWVPGAMPGQSGRQRTLKRRVSHMAINVSMSTGFVMARLFAGPLTPISPSLGTIMNIRRVETWNQGDDPTQPPPQREEVQRWRPVGRAFDPRVAVIKDTPGPLLLHEFGLEVTI